MLQEQRFWGKSSQTSTKNQKQKTNIIDFKSPEQPLPWRSHDFSESQLPSLLSLVRFKIEEAPRITQLAKVLPNTAFHFNSTPSSMPKVKNSFKLSVELKKRVKPKEDKPVKPKAPAMKLAAQTKKSSLVHSLLKPAARIHCFNDSCWFDRTMKKEKTNEWR